MSSKRSKSQREREKAKRKSQQNQNKAQVTEYVPPIALSTPSATLDKPGTETAKQTENQPTGQSQTPAGPRIANGDQSRSTGIWCRTKRCWKGFSGTWFWKPFLTSVLSSGIVAIVLLRYQLPKTLEHERQTAEEHTRANRIDELKRARISVELLTKVVAMNRAFLNDANNIMDPNVVTIRPDFNTLVWDAAKADVALLHDPQFVYELANYFAYLDGAKRRWDLYDELGWGPWSGLPGVISSRTSLRGGMLKTVIPGLDNIAGGLLYNMRLYTDGNIEITGDGRVIIIRKGTPLPIFRDLSDPVQWRIVTGTTTPATLPAP